MNLFISDALAQAAPAGGATSSLVSLLPMVLIFVIFYLLLIRPQQKRAKQHRELVAALQKGDEVVTNGGLLGKVTKVDENFVTLELAEGVRVQVQRSSVSQVMPKGTLKSKSA
ncbi:MAG: preprotein translocase subunit YajC [Pseudomonadota bacterium]|nr:preprotein translocase subunit YajC [Pseudomonadota bacterium]